MIYDNQSTKRRKTLLTDDPNLNSNSSMGNQSQKYETSPAIWDHAVLPAKPHEASKQPPTTTLTPARHKQTIS